MVKRYLIFFLSFYLLPTLLICQTSKYEKVIQLVIAENCESALNELASATPEKKSSDLQKKLEAFLAVGSHCRAGEFRKRTAPYLDSIITHPKSIEYPSLTIQAYEHKINQTYNTDKCIALFHDLIKLEEQVGTDSSLAIRYIRLASAYSIKESYGQAEAYYNQGLQLTKNKSDLRVAYMGLAHITQNDALVADSLFKIALDYAFQLDDSLDIAATLNQYGKFLKNQGNFNEATTLLIRAVNIVPQDKKLNLLRMRINCDISQLFLQLSDYKRAEEYIREAVAICEENNFRARNGVVAGIYGTIAKDTDQLELAKEELEKSLAYYEKKKSFTSALNVVSQLGDIALKENNLNKASHYHFKGLKMMEEVKGDRNKNRFYMFSGDRYIQLGDFGKATRDYQKLYAWATASNRPSSKITALSKLSEITQKTKDYSASLEYFKAYKTLEDSIYRSNQNQLVFDIESKYNRAKQDKAIAVLDTENIRKQSMLSQQKITIIIGSIALGLISLLSFFLFRLFKKVNAQKAKISKALKEKDTLLREIHHRVKNNLQLVSSLLSLQSRHVSDPSALEALNSGKSRVKSMALIHQDLYNRENLTGVSVKDYLEKLCRELLSTFQIDPERIELRTEISDLQLDVDTLVPLGLIINELLTNAMKYAFPEDRKGRIEVKLYESNGQLHLQVEDNGIGMAEVKKSKSSFGYKLIDTLLHQLHGKIHQEHHEGTQVFLTFNHYKIAA